MYPTDFPPADLELQADLPFSRHGLTLDLLRAQQRPSSPVPAILHLHGGAWIMLGKWAVDNVFLAREGYVTFSVDYRLAGDALFPAQIHDVKTAVRWIRKHASEFGIDPTRIGVWGISAGAHLAGLLGTTNGVEAFEGRDGGWEDEESAVQAIGSVCGPMDLLDPSWDHGTEPFPLFGEPLLHVPAQALAASPITSVSASTPPFTFIHGQQDEVVPVLQSERMHLKLLALGRSTQLHVLDGGHEINLTHTQRMEQHLSAFFDQHLGRPDMRSR
ncbi:alpha/beta hydrolase [Deinococcus sp. QL22]|uniref:alpha/beta hydrolase n=1 Tax=Deinococcus sp. QL22 TaxID=2939437 RepID=UPI0020181571|nr:alpha/beta hydrolase [Deinococcus sp. QL22]UQN10614.1 alpha/beta hydrolase [Deinococcus sp. QL22]